MIDLQIDNGKVAVLVQGSDLYQVAIAIRPLGAKRWRTVRKACSGRMTNLFDLLQGRLSKEILADSASVPPVASMMLDSRCFLLATRYSVVLDQG